MGYISIKYDTVVTDVIGVDFDGIPLQLEENEQAQNCCKDFSMSPEKVRLPKLSFVLGTISCFCAIDDLSCLGILKDARD